MVSNWSQKNLLVQGQFITDPTSGCLNTTSSLGQTAKGKHNLDWGSSISISEATFTSVFLLQSNYRLSLQPCSVEMTTNLCLSIFSFNVYFMYRRVVTATRLPGDSHLEALKNGYFFFYICGKWDFFFPLVTNVVYLLTVHDSVD